MNSHTPLKSVIITVMEIGYSYTLAVLERHQDTVILDGDELGPLSLPAREAGSAVAGDRIDVFLYSGADGKPLATALKPQVMRGQCASLKVTALTNAGAFLDWGLEKNLLLPFAEQRRPLDVGRYETIVVYLDNSGRLAASSRLDHHLPDTASDFRPWQPVSLLVYQRTDLGLKAVVDDRALGLLYKDEIFESVKVGEKRTGFIKRLRHDGRIDLALQPPSRQLQPALTEDIIAYLQQNDGVCNLGDKSTPEAIQATFRVSKKNFKKALSTLYRERRITVEPYRIALTENPAP